MLEDLLSDYWDAAYAEGKEGRNHDTEDGVAQQTLNKIWKEIAETVEQAHMAGQANAGVDPSYSEAISYRKYLTGR